jgi:hypothetical protein
VAKKESANEAKSAELGCGDIAVVVNSWTAFVGGIGVLSSGAATGGGEVPVTDADGVTASGPPQLATVRQKDNKPNPNRLKTIWITIAHLVRQMPRKEEKTENTYVWSGVHNAFCNGE